MRFTGKMIWSLVLLAFGVLVYVLAVSGALFGGATGPGDVGLYSITVVLVAFGLFGIYVAAREQKEQQDSDEA